MITMDEDLLDSVLSLEDVSYQAGFAEGEKDGSDIGYAEGITFGMEQGFRKAMEMGSLHGRAMMLNSCLTEPGPSLQPEAETNGHDHPVLGESKSAANDADKKLVPDLPKIPTIPSNPRLRKHIETLLKLTDSEGVSWENSDAAVDEFDERMKKAVAKAKVIDKLVGDKHKLNSVTGKTGPEGAQNASVGIGTGNIEELNNAAVRR